MTLIPETISTRQVRIATRIQSTLAPSLRTSNHPAAHLLSLGTAAPDLRWDQHVAERELATLWNLTGKSLDRWQRICRGSTIDRRAGVLPIDEIFHRTTAERMALYESFAPDLAERAACRAIVAADIDAARITDLVIVSCTGFAAPGLDIALMQRLKLCETVRRTMIGFMGCFGAITGLRSAAGTCTADPNAVVLVVCCELCTLHLRSCTSAQNQVASALFGDGAAAALVAGDHAVANLSRHPQAVKRDPSIPSLGRLTLGHSRVIPETDSLMSWRITDAGFAMTLAREVPVKLRETVASFVCEACEGWPHAIVPHPGGPGVLDAVETALPEHLAPGVQAARSVLRDFGNMSSGTVLFVLERLLETDSAHRPALLLAFGPGLTIESIELRGPDHSPPPPVASQHIG